MNQQQKNQFQIKEGWWTLLLIWAMVLVGSLAIRQADLISGLDILATVSTVGVLVGLILAKSKFSSFNAHIFALVYGLALIVFLIGRTLPGDLTWQGRIFDLTERQIVWMAKVFTEESSRDGLIFVMHTSVVYWFLGYTASWYTFRKPRVWLVVIPSGLVLLSVIYYYFGPAQLGIYLALYIVLALTYIARTYLDGLESIWQSSSVRYEQEIRFNFIRASLAVSAIAMAIAWSVPALPASTAAGEAFNDISSPWRSVQDNWTRLFASLRSYGVGTNDAYGESLTLSGPRTVGDSPIMDVFVSQQLPNVYWQGLALDTYEGGRWTLSSGTSELHLPDEGSIGLVELAAREVVTQTIVNYIPNAGIMYSAPEVVGSDRQIFVTWQDNVPGQEDELAGIKSRFVMRQNEAYNVQSRISYATPVDLRGASTDYPDHIQQTYLQVPDSVTEETLSLAADITASHGTAFDKAIAVRDYLRANITYNDQIPSPPDTVDPVHHVLFVTQQGYCNYYASAMAIMLRSQGVPTRIVQGYAQGEFDDEDNFYRVRANNAHTWVEVYFPAYGWIQFEPTSALPTVLREFEGGLDSGNAGDRFGGNNPDEGFLEDPLSADELDDLLGNEEPLSDPAALDDVRPPLPTWAIQGLIGIVLLIGVYITFVVVDRANRKVEADIDKSYGRLHGWSRWLGVTLRPVHTPYERAQLLNEAVPDGKAHINSLTHEYVLRKFSQRHAAPFFNALQEWKELRPMMIRETIARRLAMVREKIARPFRNLGR